MPSLMTCSLIYQLSMTPELHRHLRPFNNNKEEEINIYELKQQQQLQNLRKDRLQQQITVRKEQLQQKKLRRHRRWVLSTNLITILKQIKLTNPTSDIQQQQQEITNTTSTTLSVKTTTKQLQLIYQQLQKYNKTVPC